MLTLHAVLLIVAFVCFVLHAMNVIPPRSNLMGLGLALWVLSEILK